MTSTIITAIIFAVFFFVVILPLKMRGKKHNKFRKADQEDEFVPNLVSPADPVSYKIFVEDVQKQW